MVRISVSETYDLSTKVNKMSLIGIKTPKIEIIQKAYGGLLSQAKLVRFHHCDVKLACASVLPADPLQVGVEAGDIAPQDMFNPILYKAVSNQGMNEFELRMHGISGDPSVTGNFVGQSIDKTDNVAGAFDNFSVYYSLLANRKGWKVAHPQRGLSMRYLRPYVYEKLFNVGDDPSSSVPTSGSIEVAPRVIGVNSAGNTEVRSNSGGLRALRGRPRPMPAFPAHTILPANVSGNMNGAYQTSNLDQSPVNKDMYVYCGLVVMPPAKLNKFYYRLVVRWYIDLIGIRPYNEIDSFASQVSNSYLFYGTDYSIASSKDSDMGMVDVKDAEIEKIMEGA